MYLMTSTRCGISAKQLERELGVTYKTAWRMFHLIRNDLMAQDDADLGGHVEADETFIGGRIRHKPGQPPRKWNDNKTAVFGMVERGGRVVALTVPNVRKHTLMTRFVYRVLPDTTVYTDELQSYQALGALGYKHRRIRHSAGVYVSGDVHTNTIEGFWSLVKRGIAGTHHAVSAKHLQGYLNEYAWRFNHRDPGRAQFELLLARAAFVDALRARRVRSLRHLA
jgi:transposase-like protein